MAEKKEKKKKEPEIRKVIRVLVNKDQYDAIVEHTGKENMIKLEEILEAFNTKKDSKKKDSKKGG